MRPLPTLPATTRCILTALMTVALVNGAIVAEAAPIVFTDRDAFNAAAQPNLFEDFDGPLNPCTFMPECHLSYSGITFHFDNSAPPYSPASPPASLGAIQVGPWFVVSAHFDPTTAIGFDVGPLASTFGLTVFPLGCGSGCEVGAVLQPDGSVVFGTGHTLTQPGFIGFTSTGGTSFNGLMLAPTLGNPLTGPSGSIVTVDNISLKVPEPSTLLLFAVAGSALLGRRRYRRHSGSTLSR